MSSAVRAGNVTIFERKLLVPRPRCPPALRMAEWGDESRCWTCPPGRRGTELAVSGQQ